MLRLSVVIPVHRGGATFERCLARVRESVEAYDEVIVAVDGDSPEAERSALAHGAKVVALAQNRGPAAARNAGAGLARGDLIVFIDADVEVHEQTFARIRAAFEADPELDALIGSYDDAPSAAGVLSRYRNLLHHYTHQHSNSRATTFWGACGAVRREVFEESGGFNEDYRHPSIEDIELGYRLTAMGRRILLQKDIQVKHMKRWTAAEVIRTDILRRAAPWTRLLLENRSLPADLNLRWEHRLSVVLVFVLVASLLAAIWVPVALAAGASAAVILVVLNLRFYRFLADHMPLLDCIAAVGWHWIFYACSGIGAGIGAVHFLLHGSRRSSVRASSDKAFVRSLREST